jgi:hypothetical protein
MKILLLTALALCWGYIGFTQDCVRNISTNPSNPKNTEFDNFFSGKTNPWLNAYKLADYNWGAGLKSVALNLDAGWQLPWYTGGQLRMSHPYESSEASYLRPLGTSVQDYDFHWQEGWEILWVNLGYFPDGRPINQSDLNSILPDAIQLANPRTPYIIAYNRYSGKLRMFVNVYSDLSQISDIYMNLLYEDRLSVSGLFRNQGNFDKTLDQTSDYTNITTYNKNPQNSTDWWTSDVQLSYDPCICEYESKLRFHLRGIKEFDLELYGRSIGVVDSLLDANGKPTYQDFLNVSNIHNAKKGGGVLIYKHFDGIVNDYNTNLKKYSEELKDYNSPENKAKRAAMKLLKSAVVDGGSAAISGLPQAKIASILLRNSLHFGKWDIPKDTAKAKKLAKKVVDAGGKQMKSLLGKSMDQLSITLIGKQNKPKKPSMPMATFTDMRIVGTMKDVNNISISEFYTPGSFKPGMQLSAYNYPAYNEAPGLYAMLETPKVSFYESEPRDPTKGSNQAVRSQINHKLAIKLKEPLKYKLNHAVDFDFDRTQLYILFEIEMENSYYTKSLNTKWAGTVGVKEGNFEMGHSTAATSTQGVISTFTSPWTAIENIGNQYFYLDMQTTKEAIRDISFNGATKI